MGRRRSFQEDLPAFPERGYRIRLLSAAFRNHMHWSEFIGGDVVISPPYSWQVRFNASDIEVRSRIDQPVESKILEELTKKFADFRRANEEGGLSFDQFDAFPAIAGPCVNSLPHATTWTLSFVTSIPNPDVA